MHNPLAFSLTFHEEQIYKCLFGNIEHNATISEIKLSSVFFCATFAEFLTWRFFAGFPLGRPKNQLPEPSKVFNALLLATSQQTIHG